MSSTTARCCRRCAARRASCPPAVDCPGIGRRGVKVRSARRGRFCRVRGSRSLGAWLGARRARGRAEARVGTKVIEIDRHGHHVAIAAGGIGSRRTGCSCAGRGDRRNCSRRRDDANSIGRGRTGTRGRILRRARLLPPVEAEAQQIKVGRGNKVVRGEGDLLHRQAVVLERPRDGQRAQSRDGQFRSARAAGRRVLLRGSEQKPKDGLQHVQVPRLQ